MRWESYIKICLFQGRSDVAINGFAPKADVHINWYDTDAGDINGFYLKLSNGSDVYYKSATEGAGLELEGIIANAKAVVAVKMNSPYSDCP